MAGEARWVLNSRSLITICSSCLIFFTWNWFSLIRSQAANIREWHLIVDWINKLFYSSVPILCYWMIHRANGGGPFL